MTYYHALLPAGFADILYPEAAEKFAMRTQLLDAFVRFGYQSNIGLAIVFGLSDIAKIVLPLALKRTSEKKD